MSDVQASTMGFLHKPVTGRVSVQLSYLCYIDSEDSKKDASFQPYEQSYVRIDSSILCLSHLYYEVLCATDIFEPCPTQTLTFPQLHPSYEVGG